MICSSAAQLTKLRKLAWRTVWGGSLGFKPGVLISRRSRHKGGLAFIDPSNQIIALHAQWIRRFLAADSDLPWTDALAHALRQLSGGFSTLTGPIQQRVINKLPPYWRPYIQAWMKLQPHWLPAPNWTLSSLLALPLPHSYSANFPNGVPIHMALSYDPLSHFLSLLTDEQAKIRFHKAAPARLCKALEKLRPPRASPFITLLTTVLSSPYPLPQPTPFLHIFQNLCIAGAPLSELTTASARRFLDTLNGVDSALDWSTRALTRTLSAPPRDIWHRLHHPARLPRHREQWYKLLFNALPLGARVFSVWPDQYFCHTCTHAPQTIRHFIYTCPLAQAVWNALRRELDLSLPISYHTALFSWPTGSSSKLSRKFGFRLQAGHAAALHTLWSVHSLAGLDGVRFTPATVRARFLTYFRRHLSTLHNSRYVSYLS